MYTLRTIYKEVGGWQQPGVTTNISLGHSYTYINRALSELQFTEEVKNGGWAKDDHIYGVVRNETGDCIPLYSWSDHFIMTESGKTFERI